MTDVIVMKHARERAVERFDVDKRKADEWVRQKLEAAKFIDTILDDNGKPANLYAINGVQLVLTTDNKAVLTILKPRNNGEVKNKLRNFARQEITKEQTKERRRLNEVTRMQAEIEMEIGELRLRLLKTRSLPKKLAIQGRIKALKMRLDEIPQEQHVIKRKRVVVVQSLARVW